jgi:hypothetical protein
MKRLWLVVILAALPLVGQGQQAQVFTGVITETMCSRNHASMGKINTDAQCIVDCVKGSKNVKYALHDGRKIYVLSDQATPERFAAQRVRVKGVLYSKTGIIKVESIEAAK